MLRDEQTKYPGIINNVYNRLPQVKADSECAMRKKTEDRARSWPEQYFSGLLVRPLRLCD